MHNYTPTPNELVTVPAVDDGEEVKAVTVVPSIETLADGIAWVGAAGIASVGGRLHLDTFTPAIPQADVSSSSTLVWTPFTGGHIALWDGSGWRTRLSPEITLSLSGMTSGKNYDVYAYWTGSVLALELGPNWTSDTARSDSFFVQNGVYLRGTDHTRRYLGTIRATGASTTCDTKAKRFVWNYYNRVPRHLYVEDTTASWTYASATPQQANGNTANKVEVVVGDYTPVSVEVHAVWSGTGTVANVGIGLDSTSSFSSKNIAAYPGSGINALTHATYEDVLSFGYHSLNWNEASSAGSTVTFIGLGSGAQSHLRGKVYG